MSWLSYAAQFDDDNSTTCFKYISFDWINSYKLKSVKASGYGVKKQIKRIFVLEWFPIKYVDLYCSIADLVLASNNYNNYNCLSWLQYHTNTTGCWRHTGICNQETSCDKIKTIPTIQNWFLVSIVENKYTTTTKSIKKRNWHVKHGFVICVCIV